MEQYITIPTSDGFKINGILNLKEKSENLLILTHGLTGSMTEAHYYAAKEFFVQQGFTVFRFNFYAGGESNRKLHQASIADHSRDIETVLEFYSPQYKNIFLAGHSLAGPSIVGIREIPTNLRKIVHWDPAFDTSGTILRCLEKNGEYYFDPRNGQLVQISPEIFQEIKENRHMEFLERLSFPREKTFIIYAGNHGNARLVPQTDALEIESVVIEGANHGFTQEGKYEELFEKMLEFIEK